MSGQYLSRVVGRVWLAPAAIVVVCCLIELIPLAGTLGLSDAPRLRLGLLENGAFWPGLLENWRSNYPGQPLLMFVTYGFLHGGPLHLLVNMVTLLSLGRAVVERLGVVGFLVLYMAAMVGGAAGFGLLADNLRPMVGASGALFGLAGALVAWNYVDRFNFDETLWPVVRVVLLLVALNGILWWVMDGQLAWQTHLGGFVTGWVVALLLDPRGRPAE